MPARGVSKELLHSYAPLYTIHYTLYTIHYTNYIHTIQVHIFKDMQCSNISFNIAVYF
jgi:hypothetical protein